MAYWVTRLDGAAVRKVVAGGAGVVACAGLYAVVAPQLGGNLRAVGPAEMLRSGQTIWEYDGWRVAMPEDPAWVSSTSGTGAAVSYALHHPVSTATRAGPTRRFSAARSPPGGASTTWPAADLDSTAR